mmetsp:Transcript_59633/g.94676  ORF Transcript_59633/g.94676 Transcript_59633/m.94676 type:complete len:660 (+) Transcript_59633:77-2056(+)
MARIGTALVMAVLGGISVANAFRVENRVKKVMPMHEDHSVSNTTLNTTLAFPKMYTKMMDPIKLLGTGSFGEAWLVRDLQPKSPRHGQLIVMKLLYIKEAGRSKHLTWEMASNSALLKKEVIKVAKECEISKMMQGIAEKSDHPGAMRIMNCFGHNAPVSPSGKLQRVQGKAAKRPLYLLLENCGGTDLTKFMQQMARARTVDLALVQNLYKQLMEGLAFLRQLPNPWVHHDLKPDNIVVKTQTDGRGATTYSLHLIDFGAAAEVTNWRKMTPSTTIYAPPEWGVVGNFAMCPGGHSSKPDGNCGTAFDIYSAGAIFIEMITGRYMADLRGCYNNAAKDLNHKKIEQLTADTHQFQIELQHAAGSAYRTVASDFLRGTPATFLPVVAQQLKQAAGDRPIADHVMETDFLVSVVTPEDLDYVAAKERKKRNELMAQQLEQQIRGAQEHGDRINDMGADRGLRRRFKLHDKVEVYSNTAFEATGKGWVVGTVTKLVRGLKVMVSYDVDRMALEKELPDDSDLLRPFIEAVELPEGEDSVIADEEFRPSSGEHGGILDADIDAQVGDESHCPSWCDECEIAFNDSGAYKGKRRTQMSKWASFCYVDMHKKVANIKEGESEGGALCKESMIVHVGKMQFRKWLCQDLDLLRISPTYSPRENWM